MMYRKILLATLVLLIAGVPYQPAAAGSTSRSCLTAQARSLLGRIEAKFGAVSIISTCRPGARIAGTGRVSRHASGNAVDFTAPGGRKGAVVSWLIANHRSGGTMTYPGMNHIHVDIGPRFVSLAGSRKRVKSRRSKRRIATPAVKSQRVAARRNTTKQLAAWQGSRRAAAGRRDRSSGSDDDD